MFLEGVPMASLNPTWRTIYIVLGLAVLAYAVYAHLLISGLALVILIIAGVLLILKGMAAH
jgi:hypothetical protein